ncbi:MAG: NUDIX hydrolase [Solirubrobacteraceae bacterium]
MTPEQSSSEPWSATNSAGYPAPVALAVDVVVLTVRDNALLALAIESKEGPWALPGGFVGPNETPEQTAIRKLREKTGLTRIYLEQLATFADPARDPRGWIPTVAHLALVPAGTEPTDLAAGWIRATDPPALAYDHARILDVAVDRVRGKLWWSNVGVGVLPGEFTLAQARAVYEAIAGTTYDPSTFARDLRATGLITRANAEPAPTGGRPAARYRFSQQQPSWGAGRRKRIPGHGTT